MIQQVEAKFANEPQSVCFAWTDCLLDYVDRRVDQGWGDINVTDEMAEAFAAGLAAGKQQAKQ
jgi:hypothetical protein